MASSATQNPGLTGAEVRSRIEAGQTNTVQSRTSRSVWDIVRANVFTWFNFILGVLCVLMLTFGSWRDALFGFVLVANTAIGVAQEVRAKITLDRLSLISAPKAHVLRDGVPTEVGVGEVVLDDVLSLGPGEQVVVDAVMLESAGLELDESALTGEAVPVAKHEGDPVMSGSFVVAGSGLCRATAVGPDSYAMRIQREGRRFVRAHSDIMDGITRILKLIGIAMVPVAALTVYNSWQRSADAATMVTNTVAPLVAMVPEGLVLLSSIAFAVSAVELARRHVLVNELAAVETLARTDVLCADKTGTLTGREPMYQRFEPLSEAGAHQGEALEALGALAAADLAPDTTMRAIAAGVVAPAGWASAASVAFSSARKWSAVDFGVHGAWILGAPDVVLDAVPDAPGVRERLDALASQHARVLLLARAESLAEGPALPSALTPIGLVVLAEQLRPDAAETVRYLAEQGVSMRVISGDSAQTVAAIASATGVSGADRAVDARTLTDPAALPEVMERTTVFGRVMPEQKAAMVSALQSSGHTVAMTGDGVNDVVALKQADLGIAMGSGVPAARAVAQVVLLDDRFASVPHLMAEGRRVVTNAERVANLFLTKTTWAAILALVVVLLGVPYPFLPRHVTLAGSVAIGIPAFFFALEPTGRAYRPGFVRRVLRFAVPAGVVIAVAVIGVFVGARQMGMTVAEARIATTLVLVMLSLAVIAILEWPLSRWRLAVVGAMTLLGGLAFVVPAARDFFALALPSWSELAVAVAVSAVSAAIIALLTTRSRRAAA
ncbi:MAG: HAD-IC family P-type ATPase [Actinomycetia bacterium]|nr:HAD-IC family P-type ATPase [Actinomycetes bacterium]